VLSSLFREVVWDALRGWRSDALDEAFAAFRRSAFHALEKPYRSGRLGIDFPAFEEAYGEARSAGRLRGKTPAGSNFILCLWIPRPVKAVYDLRERRQSSRPSERNSTSAVATCRSGRISTTATAAGFDPISLAGASAAGIVEFSTANRAGRWPAGAEIARWRIRDVFFIHAGYLNMTGGSGGYAAKPATFRTGPHGISSEVPLAEVTMRRYGAEPENPARVDRSSAEPLLLFAPSTTPLPVAAKVP
jgi:membrane-bound lytic murein transglycosylase A